MSLAYCTGFEHQVPRADWSTYSSTNSGMFPNITIGAGGTCDYETTTVRNGTRAWRISRTSADVAMYRQVASSQHNIVGFYLYVDDLPDGGSAQIASLGTGVLSAAIKLDSNGYLWHRPHQSGSWVQSTTQLQAQAGWYLIEWYVNSSANPHVSKLRINGVAQTDSSYATGAAGNSSLQFGLRQIDATASNCSIVIDDVALFQASGDWGPGIGHGKVVVLRTAGVGTHASHTTYAYTTDNGGAWTSLTSNTQDVEQYVDEVPPVAAGNGSADGISARSAAATGYLEFSMDDITGEAYDLKGVWLMLSAYGHTGSGGGTTAPSTNLKIRSVATDANTVNWSAVNNTHRWYGGIQATDPNGGAAWTNTAWNSCVVRWGYFSFANDASWTAPRTDSIVAEAYVPTAAPTYEISGNCGIAGASVAYSGDISGTATADGSGNYVITGVPLLGDVLVTPSAPGFGFTPSSRQHTDMIASAASQNFSPYSLFGPETMGGRR